MYMCMNRLPLLRKMYYACEWTAPTVYNVYVCESTAPTAYNVYACESTVPTAYNV